MMITLVLSEQMVQAIGQVLEQAPYRLAAPILAELQKQINGQHPVPAVTNGHDNATVTQ